MPLSRLMQVLVDLIHLAILRVALLGIAAIAWIGSSALGSNGQRYRQNGCLITEGAVVRPADGGTGAP